METKFHLLPVGHHFEWEGKRYVKTSPLIANQVPEGGQKFMPRAALVKVIDTQLPSAEVSEKPVALDSDVVREAINRHHLRCMEIVKTVCLPQNTDTLSHVQHELEQNYRSLIDELNLSSVLSSRSLPLSL